MRQKQKQQAIIYILLTAFFFATMSLFVRLSGDLPTMQKAFFRNVIAAAVGLYLTLKSGSGLKMKREALPDLLGRCIFGTTGVLANFYAVDHMNLADASMLQKLAPFFAIIASYFLLREKANAIQWSCVGMAFIGALCVTKAYQLAPAKETSVYDYSQILYSAVYGILLFGEVPDLLSVIGYCIIISVAVFSWRYNLKRD